MENLNYIDVGLLALLALSLLFGLIGKAPKKIWKFIIVAGSVVFAYIVTKDYAMDYLNTLEFSVEIDGATTTTNLFGFVNSILGDVLADAGITLSTSAVEGLVTGLVKVFVFWLLCIAGFIAFGIVGGIIGAIFFSHAAKGTAIKTIGIFSVLKTAIVLVALLFPVFVLSPLVENVDAITSLVPSLAGNEAVTLVQTQFNESKVINFSDKVLGYKELDENDGFLKTVKGWFGDDEDKSIGANIEVLNYTMGEGEDATSCYTCNDVKSLPGLIELAGKLSSSSGEGSSDPIEMITSLSDEDITELFNNIEDSPAVKEVLVSVVENMMPEGVEVDLSEIDLSEEAETFIALKDVMTAMNSEEGITSENVDVDELVDAIADSNMVAALAEANPGVLESVPAETQDEIKDQLAEKLAAGEDAGGISQEQYDSLMKLFGTTGSED